MDAPRLLFKGKWDYCIVGDCQCGSNLGLLYKVLQIYCVNMTKYLFVFYLVLGSQLEVTVNDLFLKTVILITCKGVQRNTVSLVF